MTTTTSSASRKLTLDDIADARAYERERSDLRADVIELRRRRRVQLGAFVSVAFENRETVRYQIQEMARIEKLFTDEAISDELDAYNPLVPDIGELKATLFIELTSDDSIRTWLPKLVGIERAIYLRLEDGTEVHAVPERNHAAQLTRSDVTSAVHYIEFTFSPAEIDVFADGPVELVCELSAYREHARLTENAVGELLGDLVGG